MAGKITEMAAATTLAGTELVEVVQSGTNKKATVAQLLAGTQPAFGSQVANVVFAGPASGGAAAATFRPLVTADIPDLSSVYAGAVHGHAIGEVSGLGTAAARNVGTSSTNLVEVQSDGKILGSLLPALAISETFPVASQAAMLALTAQRGDVAIRTDENKSYILSTDSPGTLADWKELLSPTDGVFSFNTRAGAVTLLAGDVTGALGLTPFANPMTTAGDLITGGASGVATRLAMGSALQVLRVNAGATALEFADPSGGGLTFPLLANDTYSVSTPSYSRSGDPDTGLAFPAANTVALISGGSPALTIGATRNWTITLSAAQLTVNDGGSGAVDLNNLSGNFRVYANGNSGYIVARSPLMLGDGSTGGKIVAREQSANIDVGQLTAGDHFSLYRKADKLVIAFNNGGTLTFLTIPLDGSTTAWTQSTSAP